MIYTGFDDRKNGDRNLTFRTINIFLADMMYAGSLKELLDHSHDLLSHTFEFMNAITQMLMSVCKIAWPVKLIGIKRTKKDFWCLSIDQHRGCSSYHKKNSNELLTESFK